MENYFYALEQAIAKSAGVNAAQQFSDAGNTMLAASMQENEVNYYTAQINNAQAGLDYWLQQQTQNNSPENQAGVAQAQAGYQNIMNQQQTNTQQGQSFVDAANNQVGQDSSNEQHWVQLEAGVNQDLQALAQDIAAF